MECMCVCLHYLSRVHFCRFQMDYKPTTSTMSGAGGMKRLAGQLSLCIVHLSVYLLSVCMRYIQLHCILQCRRIAAKYGDIGSFSPLISSNPCSYSFSSLSLFILRLSFLVLLFLPSSSYFGFCICSAVNACKIHPRRNAACNTLTYSVLYYVCTVQRGKREEEPHGRSNFYFPLSIFPFFLFLFTSVLDEMIELSPERKYES